jgi:ketopantoate hydroxymethyltransferase
VRNFMPGAGDNAGAIAAFVQAVKSGAYPAHEHEF